ncbi:response regulator transcription factor [Clostridium polynesiense]|uniref:response regulator transcription factor n=1 Tax=Clostridium polynesiense TaxID=1325933 RepID=UPI00058D4DAD|nr:response regulator transcription factor [Clostridium polynesiense]
MSKILLVEDDAALTVALGYTLKNEGFEVFEASGVEAARGAFLSESFDLILLDVMLPDGNGYDFCKEVRKTSSIPIIFLTSFDEEVNVVMGLDIGGDDYLTKPFRIKELLSRIKAVLRRNSNSGASAKYIIESRGIGVDTLKGKAYKDGQEVVLTALEHRLLLLFIQNPNAALSRSQILDKLWDSAGEFVDDNTLSVYIRRLREKVEDNPAQPEIITTVRGVGYRWNS